MTGNPHRFCCAPRPAVLTDEDRVRLAGHKAALLKDTKWSIGQPITVRFLEGDEGLQARVMAVAREWTSLANLTLDFRRRGPTMIRIAFTQGNGSWSYIGRDCLSIPEPRPTMNFGWLTPASPDAELRPVVLHEFGHALGLIHEHQNPKQGIKWNRDAVIHDLSGPPNNWDLKTIENNIFAKYDPADVVATPVDPTSIMMYPIPAAWTDGTFSAGFNGVLSARDKTFIKTNYPF